MIRPGDYEDRSGLFADRDGVWRQKPGASDGVLERVPLPFLERLLWDWFPRLALQRQQARAALARLAAQGAQHASGVTVRRWDPARSRRRPRAAAP